MSLSYDHLWNLLEEKGISKTEFRKMIDISTVTLAKLSKNEAVSLSIMEKICQTLHCQIEDILEIETEKREEKWSRIREDAFYMVQLFYLTDARCKEENPVFLYGCSIEVDEGVESRKDWELSVSLERSELQIWKIAQMISGENLRALIRSMEQNKKLGEYFRECSFGLYYHSRDKRKDEWKEVFFNASICHSDKNYRPEILLIPETESSVLVKGLQPLHSFSEEPLVSESLVFRQKRELYSDKEGNLDTDKMELIREFFKMEGFLINGIKDLCRLGDFEVFSALIHHVSQEELFQIESEVEKIDSVKKVLKGFKITVFCAHLSGGYVLEVITFNGGNPTACKAYDIVVDGQDVVRTVELPESSGGIEVRLWDKNEEKKIQLVGYMRTSIIREITINYHISEKHATLEDNYIRKLSTQIDKKQKNSINRMLERYSSFESHMNEEDNDPWRKDFERVEADFGELYGAETAESMFFDQGMLAHEKFLGWLKQQINGKGIKSVWIFDPFIDADSVPRILRSLADMGVQMKIVTDAKAFSRNQDNRIDLLKKVCEGLEEFSMGQLEVYALNGKKCMLHDRMLLLFGGRYLPYVYNLSNSLDNMGMSTPSVVCKLNRDAGRKAAEYYLDLYQKTKEEGNVQVLWSGTEGKNKKGVRTISSEKEIQEELKKLVQFFNQRLEEQKLPALTCENGRILFPKELEPVDKTRMIEALCEDSINNWNEIAYFCANVEYQERKEIKSYLESSYHQERGEELQKILMQELDKEETEGDKLHSQMLKVYTKNDFRELLQIMRISLENPYDDRTIARISWPGEQALEMLIVNDFSRYHSVLQQLESESGSWQALKKKRRLILKLILIMESRQEISDALAEKCLESEIEDLIAVGICWFIKKRRIEPAAAILKDKEYSHEFFRAMLIDLQVEDCRRKYRLTNAENNPGHQGQQYIELKNNFLENMQEVKEKWVESFPDQLTAEQLKKYFSEIGTRSNKDVCELLIMLYDSQKISVEETEKYLMDCFFEKAEIDYKKEDGYWRGVDFQNGELSLNVLTEYSTETGRELFMQKLASLEKKLVKCLHDVFLQKKNYTKWKCDIDMLIWCYTMRILCQKKWKDYDSLVEKDSNLQTRQKEIRGLLKKHRIVLEKYSEAYGILCCNFEIPE